MSDHSHQPKPNIKEISELLDQVYTRATLAEIKSWTPNLDGYRILQLIGQGTFGTVYRAREAASDRDLAIKIARHEVALSTELTSRFYRECRLNQLLNHPGIVPIEKHGQTPEGLLYIVMPFCEGPTLAAWMAQQAQPIDWRIAVEMMLQISRAVGHGHSLGVIHRDLKPTNIMVESKPAMGPTYKILDFGLACSLEDSMLQTGSCVVLGTPLYMSPEQIDTRLGPISPSTDVFTLGVLLYESLAGVSPFLDDSVPKVLLNVRSCLVKPLPQLRSDIPVALQTIVDRCLRLSPKLRYRSAVQLASDFESLLNGRPITAKRLTFLQRVEEWMQSPSRTREIGLGLLVINCLVLAWAALNYPLALLFNPNGLHMPNASQGLFLPLLALIIPVHGYLLYSSYCLLNDKLSKFKQWLHLTITAAIGASTIAAVCLIPNTYYPNLDRFERLAALGLMSSFVEIQTLLILLVAWLVPKRD
jgi:serine/threonine protein kinase